MGPAIQYDLDRGFGVSRCCMACIVAGFGDLASTVENAWITSVLQPRRMNILTKRDALQRLSRFRELGLPSVCHGSRRRGCKPWPATRQRLAPKPLHRCNPVVEPRCCWPFPKSTKQRRRTMPLTSCIIGKFAPSGEKAKPAAWKRLETWTLPL
jgi:hypothetical protein